MKNIILIAPPAAGKGTLAQMLVDKYNYAHISTGDLLRDEVKKKGTYASLIKECFDKGGLVPDEITMELLKLRLSQKDIENGFILDGFPRNLEQAISYDKLISELNINLGIAVYIDVPKDVAMGRVLGRRSCPNCKTIYNINNPEMIPLKENICDKCDSELEARSDDNEETFTKRYDTYISQTSPLINYYGEKGLLYTVDGSKSMHDTFAQVEPLIKG